MNMNAQPFMPEKPAMPVQRFDGRIDTVNMRSGPDNLEIKMLDTEIRKGDFVVIDGNQPENPIFGKMSGETPIAQLEVGGYPEKGLPTQRLTVFKVGPEFNEGLRGIIEHGLDSKAEGGFLIAVSSGENHGGGVVDGFTYISPHVGFGLIGRKSNLPWVDGAGRKRENHSDNHKWTPFNESVSREQLTLAYFKGNLSVNGSSEHTPTKLYTRASPEQVAIVKKAEAAKEAEDNAKAEQERKARKIGHKIMTKIGRAR